MRYITKDGVFEGSTEEFKSLGFFKETKKEVPTVKAYSDRKPKKRNYPKHRKKPRKANSRKHWTKSENMKLIKLNKDKLKPRMIAKELGRSVMSIKSRLWAIENGKIKVTVR